MKKKKIIAVFSVIFILMLSFSSLIFNAVSADEENCLSNDYLKLTVEQDKNSLEYLRFQLETNTGEENNDSDDNKSLLYKNFFSGYTTININGNLFVYGSGTDTVSPYFDSENNQYVSSQKFNGIEVEQRLCFDKGFSDLYDDMLKVTYVVKNNNEDTNIGIRIMIDPMLDDDDSNYIKIDGIDFMNEVEFLGSEIPNIWSIDSNIYPEIHAYGKINQEFAPDKLIFADWSSLYDNRWDYSADIEKNNSDSAVAFVWKVKTVKSGESITYSAYYGVKNTLKIAEDSEVSTESELSSKISTENSEFEESKTDVPTSSNETSDTSNNTSLNTGDSIPLYMISIVFVSGTAAIILFRKRRCK